jgi:hypothetical protein
MPCEYVGSRKPIGTSSSNGPLPWRRRRLRGFVLALSICMIPMGGTATAQNRLFLLTADEATRLRLGHEDQVLEPMLRGTAGPRIVVQEPSVRHTSNGSVIETTPSTRFLIVFEPNGAPIDMESLEIKAKKGILSMSLTPRLKPFIQGTSLKADSVSVPEGKFQIQIEILDTAGTRTLERYRLEVRQLGS